jgi:hypothetical protein
VVVVVLLTIVGVVVVGVVVKALTWIDVSLCIILLTCKGMYHGRGCALFDLLRQVQKYVPCVSGTKGSTLSPPPPVP